MLRDSTQGAAISLNAAVNPELNKEEFVYYSDCQPAHPSAAAMWVIENVQMVTSHHKVQLTAISPLSSSSLHVTGISLTKTSCERSAVTYSHLEGVRTQWDRTAVRRGSCKRKQGWPSGAATTTRGGTWLVVEVVRMRRKALLTHLETLSGEKCRLLQETQIPSEAACCCATYK